MSDIPSAFVELRAVIDTSTLPDDLRPLIEFYNEVFFELPILKNGTLIPFEEVVAALNRDTLFYSVALGIGGSKFECGSFSQNLVVELKLEVPLTI